MYNSAYSFESLELVFWYFPIAKNTFFFFFLELIHIRKNKCSQNFSKFLLSKKQTPKNTQFFWFAKTKTRITNTLMLPRFQYLQLHWQGLLTVALNVDHNNYLHTMKNILKIVFNSLYATALVLYPRKMPKTLWFSDAFWEV